VALQAQQAGLADPQQARVGSTVRRMTTRAALGLDRQVLEHEGPLLVGVALDASRIAASRTTHIPKSAGAMEIVAICALHKTLIHPMVEGFGKLRLRGCMTLVAELRLAPREQAMLFLGVMWRVAVETANIVTGVRRPVEVHLPFVVSVTRQAAGSGLLPREIFKANDLADVPSSGNVFTSGSVT